MFQFTFIPPLADPVLNSQPVPTIEITAAAIARGSGDLSDVLSFSFLGQLRFGPNGVDGLLAHPCDASGCSGGFSQDSFAQHYPDPPIIDFKIDGSHLIMQNLDVAFYIGSAPGGCAPTEETEVVGGSNTDLFSGFFGSDVFSVSTDFSGT